jgi:vacuolar-type H+-ATPase subunit C/Vma6
MGKYYFLASVVSAMPGSLGDKLPIPFADISTLVQRNTEPEDIPLVRALLMSIDVSNVEAIYQGRDIFTPGGTLSREEIDLKQSLPLFIRTFLEDKERGSRRPYLYDGLWEGYYAYAYSLGQERGCRFLTDYLTWDIGLRNHLVVLRAREKGGEGEENTLLPHVGAGELSNVLIQVKGQKNPLWAERVLDEERLKQVFHCEGSDPFSLDAILALLERARIFSRWERMNSPFEITQFI